MATVIGGSVFPPVDLTPARVLGLQKSVAASFSFRNMLSLRLLNEVSPIRSDAANAVRDQITGRDDMVRS